MGFEFEGLEKLQKEFALASKALQALDGEITTLRFDPSEPASVEAAIAQLEQAIDDKIGPYRGNPMVESVATQMKEKYREQILERASVARLSNERKVMSQNKIDPSILRDIENTVVDLRSADYNSFARHIRKLSRLIHSSELDEITRNLVKAIDLDAWLDAGYATQGGMVGSAQLEWPSGAEEELGIVVCLIDRFAEQPDKASEFARTFYYYGDSLTGDLQKMTAQMFIPFARDYINYVKGKTGTVEATLLPPKSSPSARKVFVVHGHDDGARESVARFLEKLDFEAIILHEQANQGRTVIEKIEAHGDVGFAVILLTPDDVGSVKGGEPQPRARQNVMLELGYFVGRLGRSRVCALKRGDLELPSDFGGVVYEDYDAGGGWKDALGRELQAAGFEIDWNVIMRR
jgi:hypothetical protein